MFAYHTFVIKKVSNIKFKYYVSQVRIFFVYKNWIYDVLVIFIEFYYVLTKRLCLIGFSCNESCLQVFLFQGRKIKNKSLLSHIECEMKKKGLYFFLPNKYFSSFCVETLKAFCLYSKSYILLWSSGKFPRQLKFERWQLISVFDRFSYIIFEI